MQEGQLAARRDEEQPVGLAHAAGDLGQELCVRHPDGDRETDQVPDLATQMLCDLDRGPRDPLHSAHVKERLVDGERLDDRSGPPEDLEHTAARAGVGIKARRDDDRVRAQRLCSGAPHRRAHAASLGLVAGGKHDPATDDHRAPAQRRVVALLDRGVEGVEVGVEDCRRSDAGHEHTFA